ncbi:SMI1/KNR4 family protein [Roseiconus nitratireducens]|uniref:SMI1/KNR4 family protein n=1 Tax=Roseiconus nitratireducens TaxID=2605748 RepID=A0A5M6DC14_9BACT|nr:SMI1/KNR4 family protein [Roseiconus nitratireducens]KAA5543862.1 SMI1/KNR4 family protein [Roseiconus nitratireducens]
MNEGSHEVFENNTGATTKEIAEVEAAIGSTFPNDYREFLIQFNGGEGYIGETYLFLWKAEELIELNYEYEVAQYCSNLLLIGSNGGGEAIGFATASKPWSIVKVPFVGMDDSLIETCGKSFSEFLKNARAGDI